MVPTQKFRKSALALIGVSLFAFAFQACDDGVYRFEPGPNAIKPPEVQPVDQTLYEDEKLVIREEFLSVEDDGLKFNQDYYVEIDNHQYMQKIASIIGYPDKTLVTYLKSIDPNNSDIYIENFSDRFISIKADFDRDTYIHVHAKSGRLNWEVSSPERNNWINNPGKVEQGIFQQQVDDCEAWKQIDDSALFYYNRDAAVETPPGQEPPGSNFSCENYVLNQIQRFTLVANGEEFIVTRFANHRGVVSLNDGRHYDTQSTVGRKIYSINYVRRVR